MHPGTRVKITGGIWQGQSGVVIADDEELADDGELKVALEVFGRQTTAYVLARDLVDVTDAITPLATIESEIREAVGRRGFNQRVFGWWVERAAAGADDLDLLDGLEVAFRAALDAERAEAERAALAEVHAAFAGLDERAREELWQARRAAWTEWRSAAPAATFSEAESDAALALRERLEGHRRRRALERDDAPLASNEALEALVEAQPDAVEPRLVYADWLAEAGDPRGELMQREARGEAVPRGPFLGALAPFEGTLEATWRVGFVESARVEVTRADERAGLSVTRLLGHLLALPTARALRELTVFLPSVHEEREDVVAALAARVRPALRTLTLTTNEEEEMLSWTGTGDLAPLGAALPGLEALMVRAGSLALSSAEELSSSLTRLSIETVGMRPEILATIARAAWPRLEALTVWCGSSSYGVEVRADDFAELLTRCELPSLRALDLSNNEVTDELAAMVLASPLLPRLESLTLSKGTLTAAGAKLLVDGAARLRHLDIDLTENYLDDDSVAALEAALPRALLGEQRTAETYAGELWRYAAVGE